MSAVLCQHGRLARRPIWTPSRVRGLVWTRLAGTEVRWCVDVHPPRALVPLLGLRQTHAVGASVELARLVRRHPPVVFPKTYRAHFVRPGPWECSVPAARAGGAVAHGFSMFRRRSCCGQAPRTLMPRCVRPCLTRARGADHRGECDVRTLWATTRVGGRQAEMLSRVPHAARHWTSGEPRGVAAPDTPSTCPEPPYI